MTDPRNLETALTSPGTRRPERTARSKRALRALVITTLAAVVFLIVSVFVVAAFEDSLPLWLGPWWFLVMELVLFAIPGLLIAIAIVGLWPSLLARKPSAIVALVGILVAVLVVFAFVVVGLGSQLG